MTMEALRRGVERYMREVVVISRTSAGPVDDPIDPATLKPVPNSGETPTTIYNGKALVTPDTAAMVTTDGSEVEVDRYRLFLPASAPLPAPGDRVTLTTTTDPALTAASLVVDSAESSSFIAARVARVRLLVAARPVHGG